jgi:uncharacterized membrane protein YdjX (TVP38/TMEM64 family)
MHHLIRRFWTRRNMLILLGLLAVASLFTVLGQYFNVADWLRQTFLDLVGYNYLLAAAVFVALAAFSAVFTFFTSTPLVPIASAIWGKGFTLALLFGGWIIGAIIAYFIGHLLSHFLARFKVFKKIKRYRDQLGDGSSFLLVLLFRLAVPAEIASYTLGLLRYRFDHYMIATLISDLPFAVLAIYSSSALLGPHPMLFALFMLGGLIAITLFLYLFHVQLKKIRGISVEE